MKIYTRTGDKGQTSLFGGERVSKTHGRVAAYGALDELNSCLGLCICVCRNPMNGEKIYSENYDPEIHWLLEVQRDLFALGSWLASKEASERVNQGLEAFAGSKKERTQISEEKISAMESQIDLWEKNLSPMKAFILPGGSLAGAQAHMARTLCRRAEREAVALKESGEVVPELVIRYLNRLADALFVLARHLNQKASVPEDQWL